MALCLAQVWTSVSDYGWCAVSHDGALIVGRNNSLIFSTLSTADYSTTTFLFTRTGAAACGQPGLDVNDKIYWIESPDYTTYSLMRANLDGSGITTVASPLSASPTMASTFEVPDLAYDPVNDLFWMTSTASGGRLRTISKTGTITNIYSPPSSSARFRHPLIDSQGGVWHRWSDVMYRTDSVAHTTVSASDLFGNAFPAVALDLGGNGIVEDSGSTDSLFRFVGGVITETKPSPCTIFSFAFGFTPTFWTPDWAGIWYSDPGASSPNIDAYLWGQFSPITGIPPLAIYARGDDLPTGAPIIPTFHRTWQRSGRIMQGAGHA